MEISVQILAQQQQAIVRGDGHRLISDVAPLATAAVSDVAFVESARQLKALEQSRAGAVFVTPDVANRANVPHITLLVVTDPFTAFMSVMAELRPARQLAAVGISASARVDPSARIAAGTEVHAGAYIGADVCIGEDCLILPGAILREGCVLGNQCVIHPNVVLYPDVRLGNRVILHANSVLGADGFGYRFVNGAFERIPHRGTVIIEDDVEVGACTTVDRGMIGPTVIGRGTKLDNLVMIAHNCQVGRHNAFASQVGLAGSVTTGDYVRAGGQAGVCDHVTVGNQVSLGGKCGVISDVPDGETYHGIPAGPEKEQLRSVLTLRKAPQVFEQVKQLQKQLLVLQAQVAALTESQGSESAAA